MKNKITLGLVFLIICGVLCFAPHSLMQKQGTTTEAPKFALLVGINTYKDFKENKIRDLKGTNNDVELMKNLLVDVYKFSYIKTSEKSPVKILLNTQATQAGILAAFKNHLIANAKLYKEQANVSPDKGATIVFFYSGHGSKLADQNGDESDGVDETIVAQDSDTNGIKDIRDDEFDKFFEELRQYTTNITFIFDSCHSGTITRGGTSKSVRRDIKLPNNSRGGDANLNDGMSLSRNDSYVTISGSLPTQESQEDLFVDPDTKKEQWNGALTYSLVHLLRQNPDATYREIMNQVQTKVVDMNRNQTPQAEGDVDRIIFGSALTRGKTPIFIDSAKVVKKTIDEKEVEVKEISLKVGTIVGAGDGAAIAIYGRKGDEKAREQIGSGTITSATAFTSTAEVTLFDENTKEIPKDATIFIVSPSFKSGDKRKVALDIVAGSISKGANSTVETVSRIEDKLKDNSLLETVRVPNILTTFNSKGATNDWDVAVVRGTYKDFKYGNRQPDVKDVADRNKSNGRGDSDPCSQKRFEGDKPTEPKDDEAGFFLSNRSGMPLYNLWYSATDENAAGCLADALEKHARIENLRNLTSGGSGLNEGINVELVRLKSFDLVSRNPLQCKSEPVSQTEQEQDREGIPQFKADDKFYLKITNTSKRDLYVYLYTLTTSGKIGLLYPSEGAAAGEKLLRGKTISTLENLAPGSCGAFFIEPPEQSPPGMETLKIIATTQEFPGKMLEQPSIARNSRSGSPLNQLLMQAATGARTGTMKFAVSDWTTKNLNIEIVR